MTTSTLGHIRFDALLALSTAELTQWMLRDERDNEGRESAQVHESLVARMDALDATAPVAFVDRWMEASAAVSDLMKAESAKLRRYVRTRRAGIVAVIDGGPDAA